jgi:sarcosine oxidase/L-pipecolate oxidase
LRIDRLFAPGFAGTQIRTYQDFPCRSNANHGDRPKGDFLITYHPDHPNLFLATGGSGHGYKFLPILGEKIVDALEGTLDAELARLWKWPEVRAPRGPVVTKDGSRSGAIGLVLRDELAR